MRKYNTHRALDTIFVKIFSATLLMASCTGADIVPPLPPTKPAVAFSSTNLTVAENSVTGVTFWFNLPVPAAEDIVLNFYTTNYYTGYATAEIIEPFILPFPKVSFTMMMNGFL